jgi:hypothetical protein
MAPRIASSFLLAALAFILARTAQGTPTCADPSRTILVTGAAACRVYDQDPASCASAWAVAQTGQAVSCFYASNQTCQGCGPNNQASGACINTCQPAPAKVPALPEGALALLATGLLVPGAALLRGRKRRESR